MLCHSVTSSSLSPKYFQNQINSLIHGAEKLEGWLSWSNTHMAQDGDTPHFRGWKVQKIFARVLVRPNVMCQPVFKLLIKLSKYVFDQKIQEEVSWGHQIAFTLIGESSRVRSLIHCTLLCEKTPDCNALGYNGSTQLCRRAGALFAPSALNSQCVANEIVFKSGKIVRLAKSNQFDKLLNVCFPKVFSKMNFSSKLFLSQPTATKHNDK